VQTNPLDPPTQPPKAEHLLTQVSIAPTFWHLTPDPKFPVIEPSWQTHLYDPTAVEDWLEAFTRMLEAARIPMLL